MASTSLVLRSGAGETKLGMSANDFPSFWRKEINLVWNSSSLLCLGVSAATRTTCVYQGPTSGPPISAGIDIWEMLPVISVKTN